jgi:hypothetical protein
VVAEEAASAVVRASEVAEEDSAAVLVDSKQRQSAVTLATRRRPMTAPNNWGQGKQQQSHYLRVMPWWPMA